MRAILLDVHQSARNLVVQLRSAETVQGFLETSCGNGLPHNRKHVCQVPEADKGVAAPGIGFTLDSGTESIELPPSTPKGPC